jgi:phenylpropionate dioxygenase-like ring-hydroxylating dioxygenase large terminal subunit
MFQVATGPLSFREASEIPMSRRQLIEMTRRHMAHAKAGTVDQAPDVFRVPAAHYCDPHRGQLEHERIWRRLPLMLGFSAELGEKNAYRAMEVAGVPVLLTRDGSDGIRAFVNMCSHRGAQIVAEGIGQARRFVCPYHAWTYDTKGNLAGILDSAEFGELDRSCLGLTPLPVTERAGMIFVVLQPQESFDFDAYFQGYDEMLDHLGLGDCHVVGRQSVDGPNWKIAYDGYLDFYHLPILHRESFGSEIGNKAVYDNWGPHQRVNMPFPGMEKLEEKPEADWSDAVLLAGIWTIFPHISIATFDAGGPLYMVSQLFPGEAVDKSITLQTFLSPQAPDAKHQAKIQQQMEFLHHVVQDEDYATGTKIGRALATGTKKNVLFGRNEGGGQCFHSWVDALLETDDDGLPELFARQVGPTVR